MDTRQKLEADIRQWLDSRLIGNEVFETVISWINRQAEITAQAYVEWVDTADELQAMMDELTDERDRLLEQLDEYDGECYRGATSVQWYEHSMLLQSKLEEMEQTHMRLPVDVDGVPIRIGDTMERVCAEVPGTFIVGLIGADGHCMDDETSFFIASECRHVKPDTIEDIIAEAMSFACEPESPYSKNSKYVRQYAERIRKVIEEWQH